MGMMDEARAGKDLYATFDTTEGQIVVKLFAKDAPETVQNFVGLATGEKEWKHPATNERMVGKPLYDGTIFHRCIPNFMVQGGDPLGKGTGGPGFQFKDEFQSGRRFDRKGLLAMANAGPNTNGSQFFITVAPTPHLDDHHSVFGEVSEGYDVVKKISEVPRSSSDRPNKEVKINSVRIERPQS